MWERSFVAMSALAGTPVEEALGALGEASAARLGSLPDKLRDPRRAARAQAIAEVAHEVSVALDEVTLR